MRVKSIKTKGKFNKIIGRMAELGYTQEKLAKEMNISQVSLSNKLNGNVNFTWDELALLIKLLNIKDNEISDFLFADVIRNRIA